MNRKQPWPARRRVRAHVALALAGLVLVLAGLLFLLVGLTIGPHREGEYVITQALLNESNGWKLAGTVVALVGLISVLCATVMGRVGKTRRRRGVAGP
jgi:hypothetical protein